MEIVDRLGHLLAKPQQSVPSPASTNNCSVGRHLDFLEESVQTIWRVVENPDFVD